MDPVGECTACSSDAVSVVFARNRIRNTLTPKVQEQTLDSSIADHAHRLKHTTNTHAPCWPLDDDQTTCSYVHTPHVPCRVVDSLVVPNLYGVAHAPVMRVQTPASRISGGVVSHATDLRLP